VKSITRYQNTTITFMCMQHSNSTISELIQAGLSFVSTKSCCLLFHETLHYIQKDISTKRQEQGTVLTVLIYRLLFFIALLRVVSCLINKMTDMFLKICYKCSRSNSFMLFLVQNLELGKALRN